MAEPDTFAAFVAARSPGLIRIATLVTGSEAVGEQLVLAALVRARLRWRRVVREDDPEAQLRRDLVANLLPAAPPPADTLPTGAEGDVLLALGALPVRQRAAVVLRFAGDCSEIRVAEALRCPVDVVRTETAQAVAALASALPAGLTPEQVAADLPDRLRRATPVRAGVPLELVRDAVSGRLRRRRQVAAGVGSMLLVTAGGLAVASLTGGGRTGSTPVAGPSGAGPDRPSGTGQPTAGPSVTGQPTAGPSTTGPVVASFGDATLLTVDAGRPVLLRLTAGAVTARTTLLAPRPGDLAVTGAIASDGTACVVWAASSAAVQAELAVPAALRTAQPTGAVTCYRVGAADRGTSLRPTAVLRDLGNAVSAIALRNDGTALAWVQQGSVQQGSVEQVGIADLAGSTVSQVVLVAAGRPAVPTVTQLAWAGTDQLVLSLTPNAGRPGGLALLAMDAAAVDAGWAQARPVPHPSDGYSRYGAVMSAGPATAFAIEQVDGSGGTSGLPPRAVRVSLSTGRLLEVVGAPGAARQVTAVVGDDGGAVVAVADSSGARPTVTLALPGAPVPAILGQVPPAVIGLARD